MYKSRFIIFLLSFGSQIVTSQDCGKYFSHFETIEDIHYESEIVNRDSMPRYSDSLPYKIKMIDTFYRDDMCHYNFEISYENKSYDFWVGIKDSIIYSFKNNKLKKPVKMFSLKDTAETEDVYFYPFATNGVSSGFPYGRIPPKYDDDKLFIIYPLQRNLNTNLSERFVLQSIWIRIKEGIHINILDLQTLREYNSLRD